jgi:hypothetical protein
MKKVTKYFAILLVALATVASAQTFDPIGSGVITQQISSSVVPENPTPGQEVTISLTAYGTDLDSASISWSVNGTKIQSGTGMTQFKIAAGKNGETKKIVATIIPTSGTSITQTFTITPQDVSIIYESDGYVPPFYKGKGVYTREGTVTLIAVPNLISGGVKLNPNTLTYKWTIDGTVQGSKSGYGRSSYTYTGSILGKDSIVEVEVSSVTGNTKGKGLILLSPQEPQVLLYEQNPLYGKLFNKELSTFGFSLPEKEATVVAIPYSTSAAKLTDGTLSFDWTINGSTIPVPKTQNYATFRNTTDQSGTSLIGVSVNNSTHLLQSMRNSLSINF